MNNPAQAPIPPFDETSAVDTKALEAEKLRSEANRNKAEAVLKRLEARRLLSKPRWIELSVPGATVIVSVIGFLGSFVASYVKGWSDLELTRQKYDSDLVLKAVATDAKQSRENLRFLLEAGLIKDADGRLAKAVADPTLSIRLPSQIGASLQEDLSVEQMLNIVNEVKKATNIDIKIGVRKINEPGMSAYAMVASSGFDLVYTQSFVDSLRRSSRTNWSAYGIVAHEIAHMALNHFALQTSDPKGQKQLELEADKWSGMALAKLGATLLEALAIQQALPEPEFKSQFAPSREERISAVERGWRSAAPTSSQR